MAVPTSVGKPQKVALPVNADLALSSPKTNETASVSTCNQGPVTFRFSLDAFNWLIKCVAENEHL